MSQTANKLKRCSKCYISNKLPNIQLDETGVCNLCLSHDEVEHLKNEKSALKDMLAVFRSVKEASKKYFEFTKTEEHGTMNETKRKEIFKEIFGDISIDSEEMNISIPQEEDNERLGYDYDEDKDIEDDDG